MTTIERVSDLGPLHLQANSHWPAPEASADQWLFAEPSFVKRTLPRELGGDARRKAAALLATFTALGLEDEAHCRRVARWSRRLAIALGLSPEHVDAIELGALLHDVGYLHLRQIDFDRPGPLNAGETFELHRHPDLGARLVQRTPGLAGAAPLLASHHERYDGTGYPRGLRGTEIPIDGRIFQVVDAYEALTHERPHRARMPASAARALIARGAGTQFDPAVVCAFAAIDSTEWELAGESDAT